MAHVVSIAYTPKNVEQRPENHYARVVAERVTLVADFGIEGDTKGGSGSRQLNIMSSDMLAKLREEGYQVGPGQMGEQIVVSGIALEALEAGARIQIGESAIVSMSMPRVGCSRFERIQGHPKRETRGRMGIMAHVERGGEIAVGDEVRVLRALEQERESQ